MTEQKEEERRMDPGNYKLIGPISISSKHPSQRAATCKHPRRSSEIMRMKALFEL